MEKKANALRLSFMPVNIFYRVEVKVCSYEMWI